MKFTRKCPKCKKDIKHKRRNDCQQAVKNKKLCRSCGQENLKINGNIKLREKFKSIYPRFSKNCKVCKKEFTTAKWDKNKKYCSNECYHNDSDVKNGKFIPGFNKEACYYFDELNIKLGWKGVYGTNKGEKKVKKYWVDYYEPNLNIVIEWDEKCHNYYNKKRELKRQQEIIEYLGCKFFRINENLEIKEIN